MRPGGAEAPAPGRSGDSSDRERRGDGDGVRMAGLEQVLRVRRVESADAA